MAAVHDDHGVHIVEQPAATPDGCARVRDVLPPHQELLLDDTVRTVHDYAQARARGTCDRLLVKVGKHGGLMNTLRLVRRAEADGVPCHLGCHVGETSLLAAAGRIAAALCDFETHEGSYGPLLLRRDVCAAPLGFGFGGVASVRPVLDPGLGIEVSTP